MDKVTDAELEDIFHIPKTDRKTNAEQDELPSFEEKKTDLVDELGDDIPKTKTLDITVDIPVEKKSQDVKVMIEGIVETANKEDKEDDIESILGIKPAEAESEAESEAEAVEPSPVIDFDINTEEQKSIEEPEPEVQKKDPVDYGLPEGEIFWLTECPSPKFENFYNEKINVIRDISHGKQIPFSKLREELRNSHTDISCRVFDTGVLYAKMGNVHIIKQRVAQIQVDVNSQYFEWERMVELMHGVLARTQYERGKQEGIQYEHMRDMEVYYARLKSLHKIADNIQKNLDSAIEVLSRQVTIVQEKYKRKEGSAESFDEYTDRETSERRPVSTCISSEVPKELAEFEDLAIGSVTTKKSPEKTEASAKGIIKQGWDAI